MEHAWKVNSGDMPHRRGPLYPLWDGKRIISNKIRFPKREGVGIPFLKGFTEHSYITFRLEAGLPEPGGWKLTTASL